MYCKDCVHWKRNPDYYELKNYGSCNSEKFNYEFPNKNEDDNLVYVDSEGWSASFQTGENFGCIHYKNKN